MEKRAWTKQAVANDLGISSSKSNRKQAHKHRISFLAPLTQVAKQNWRAFYQTLLGQIRKPFSTLLISGIIGIAMALPSGLYLLVVNLQAIENQWPHEPQLTLFTHKKVSYFEAQNLAKKINNLPGVKSIKVLSPGSAMEEYRNIVGLGENELLPEQKLLPSILIIAFDSQSIKPDMIKRVKEKIEHLGQTESVHLDQTAVEKLYKLIEIGERSILVIGTIFAVGVLLIVGGTIRLEIQNKHNEILVIKLIGGTNAYVRRPFLYSGFWHGIFGGLLAWLLTLTAVMFLSNPVADFAQLSNKIFNLVTLDMESTGILIGSSALLGLLGSWFSVGRHLAKVEP